MIAVHLDAGLVAISVFLIRMIMVPMLLYNVWWSFVGAKKLLRGTFTPAMIHEASVFFFSLGLLGYHSLAAVGRIDGGWAAPYSLALQCILFVATLCALIGHRLAITVKFERLYWLFTNNNLDVAVRAAHLNAIDPEYIEGALTAAEATLAVRIIQNNHNGTQ